MFIDTHTHLTLITKNETELKNIINTCDKHNIKELFTISVDFESNFLNLGLSEKYENIFFSVGLHPSEADNINQSHLEKIEQLISHKKCIGIGETGLDFYRNYSSIDNQIKLFKIHLNFAKQYKKPIIIHSRDSFEKIIEIISLPEYKNVTGVFHCFSYGPDEAEIVIDKGYKISFAGNLTFKNSVHIQAGAKTVPLKYIMCETDSPYLAPIPYRGKTNYPYYITETIKFLSELRSMPINKIESEIEKNIRCIFHSK